jgi:hypothetical protein
MDYQQIIATLQEAYNLKSASKVIPFEKRAWHFQSFVLRRREVERADI